LFPVGLGWRSPPSLDFVQRDPNEAGYVGIRANLQGIAETPRGGFGAHRVVEQNFPDGCGERDTVFVQRTRPVLLVRLAGKHVAVGPFTATLKLCPAGAERPTATVATGDDQTGFGHGLNL